MKLTGKQLRHLRGLGHALSAVVQIGKEGISEGLVRAVDQALKDHELIKVKLGSETPEDRDEAAEALSTATRSSIAQLLGGTILLYRRHPNKPVIVLPKEKAATLKTKA